MTNVFRPARPRHNTKVGFSFRDSSGDWLEEWRQSRFFVRAIRNFCNVTRSYRNIDYFRFFNIISMQKSLPNSDSSSSTSETPPKSEPDSPTRAPQRQRFSAHDLNDSPISFGQRQTSFSGDRRQNSPPAPSFSPLSGASNLTSSRRQTTESDFTSRSPANFRRQISGATSAEEALYHHPIGPSSSPSNNDDMAISSNQLQRVINAAIDSYIQRHPPISEPSEPAEPSEPRDVNGLDDTNADDNVSASWIADELDFFHPRFDEKTVQKDDLIAHQSKNTYFRDVHFFIRRANDVTQLKRVEKVRLNLWFCLKEPVINWWTDELSKNEKLMTTLTADSDDKLKSWKRLLLARFKQPFNIALKSLLSERYTLRNVVNRREPRKYAQRILLLTLNANLDNVKNQLDTIYNGIDSSLRKKDIKRSKNETIINGFLEELDDCKHDWWNYGAKAMRMQSRSQQQQPPKPAPSGQYNSSATGRGGSQQPNFQRRPPASSNQYRPNAYSNNQQYQYGYQNRSYPSYPSYQGGYQNQNAGYGYPSNQPGNQYGGQNQNRFSNAGSLQSPAGRLQITVGPGTTTTTTNNPSSGSNSSSQRQSFQSKSNQGDDYQNNRGGFQNRSNNAERFDRSQSAYQVSVEDESEMPMPSENTSKEQGYHSEDNDENWGEKNGPMDDPWDYGEFEANFVTSTTMTSAIHACQRCKVKFTSKNKLFKHLRSECWKADNCHVAVASDTNASKTSDTSEAGNSSPASETGSEPRRLVEFIDKPILENDYIFRGSHYVTTLVKESYNEKTKNCCLNIGCPLSIDERVYAREIFSTAKVKQLVASLSVRDINNTIHSFREYIVVDVFMNDYIVDEDGKQTSIIDKFLVKIHIVDDLKINLLLRNDVLKIQRATININAQTITLISCNNFVVSINTIVKKNFDQKRIMRIKVDFKMSAEITMKISIFFHDSLSENRDFLFESQCQQSLDHENDVFAHIIDAVMNHVMMRNISQLSITLRKRFRLDTLINYNQQECYNLTSNADFLATDKWKTTKQHQRDWKEKLNMIVAAVAYVASLATRAVFSKINTITSSVLSTTTNCHLSQVNISSSTVIIDSVLKHILFNDVIVYEESNVASRITEIVNVFSTIWNDQRTIVDISENQWMSITLKSNAKLKSARIYSVSVKNREIIDAIFDKMHKNDKITWITQSTSFSFSIFVVWKNIFIEVKSRVIMNIRDLNKITKTDSYSLSLPSDLISFVADYDYISIGDAGEWFHQFNVRRADKQKFIVISHRDQKQFNVALMKFKNSSFYVQRQTDQLLRLYRQFSRAFMNDIMIFSRTLKKHLLHLRQIFELFRNKRVNLASAKFLLNYSSIILFDQRMNNLDLFISTKKIAVITSFRFSETLKNLKYFLNLIEWLRHCVERYAQLTQSLTERKTVLIKLMTFSSDNNRKRQSTQLKLANSTSKKMKVFRRLQQVFAESTFLTHFDSNRRLFIDLNVFKKWDFAAMIYHVVKNLEKDFLKIDVQSIFFLNKLLNETKKNYWFTELKIAEIVWIIKKIRHMIKFIKLSSTIIYTNHFAAISIFRQTTLITTSIDKFNLRFVRVSQYLFNFNLTIRHKTDKFNVISDALSRLSNASQSNVKNKVEILNVLYDHHVDFSNDELRFATFQNMSAIAYHIILMKMSDDFKKRLKTVYVSDTQWIKILAVIFPSASDQTENDNDSQTDDESPTSDNLSPSTESLAIDEFSTSSNLSLSLINKPTNNKSPSSSELSSSRDIKFRLRNDLIYYVFEEEKNRLCISEIMKHEIFQMIHDLNNHENFHRAYDRLINFVYVRHLTKRLRIYIEHCSQCQLNQIKRHSLYDSLQSINTSMIFFHTLTINFIFALLIVDDMNCALTAICKCSKKQLIVSDKNIYDVENWVNVFITALMIRDWDISKQIISDRNRKFVFFFWRTIFLRLKIILLMFAAYHSQIDEQFERINQTLKIALRFWLSNSNNINWLKTLSYLTTTNNNATSVTIDFVLNELIYEFRVNDSLTLLKNLPTKNYNRLRQIKRKSVEEVMTFVNVMRKLRYDAAHIELKLTVDDYVYLCLYHDYTILDLINKKLNQQRVDFFKILKKINTLTYRLELSSIMQIHSMISKTQLKSASTSDVDLYRRSRSNVEHSSFVQLKNDSDSKNSIKFYEIEKLLNRRIIVIDRINYLIKWKSYESQNNV